jgi:hypothetical protein
MPTLLPHRDPAPPKQSDFSPVLVLIAAALAIALIWVEAQMLGGSDPSTPFAQGATQQHPPANG